MEKGIEKSIKEATYQGVFKALKKSGYKAEYLSDCEMRDGSYNMPMGVGMIDNNSYKEYNLPVSVWIHVKGDPYLGRKMNKSLKKAGYTTRIVDVRVKYILFMVENDWTKIELIKKNN